MKRLEDIPKKVIFEVPEGYFDKLPEVIQARVAPKKESLWRSGYFTFAVRYALPVVLVAAALFFIIGRNDLDANPEELLASISSEELTSYLVESDFTTEELLDNINLSESDVQALDVELLSYPELESLDLEAFTDELPIEF